jgi:hypothetical protein
MKHLQSKGKVKRTKGIKFVAIATMFAASAAIMAVGIGNPPGDAANPINIIAFPQRDFVSSSGYLSTDRVVVRVIHNPTIYPGATGGTTDDLTRTEPDGSSLSWIQPTDAPDLPPADPTLGIVEVNHPGGACWVGQTPDIRPGDQVQIEIMADYANTDGDGNPLTGGRVGRIDETVVQNVTAKRPVQTGPSTVAIHGAAQTSFSGVAPTGPLPSNVIEQRLVSPGNLFDLNNKRTLRADTTGLLNGTLVFDPIGVDNPNGINWTATYTGLSAADVERALAAETRGMWLGNAVLPAGEITTFELGAAVVPGPQAPCSAPLEVLPAPDGVDDLPPNTPTGLTADTLGSPNSVTLNWVASTDNITPGDLNDNPGVTSYGIYRINGLDGTTIAVANVQNPDGTAPAPVTYVDKNVPPGSYTYKVDAADSIGNRSAKSVASAPEVITAINPDPNPADINEPPAGTHALLAFPSRDFVSAEGFNDVDSVSIEIIRNGIIVSNAEALIPDETGLVEVNHPGGFCWDGVTPEIRAGDIFRATGFRGSTVVSIDQIHVANVTAKKAVLVTAPGLLPATLKITGTAQDSNGVPIPIDQLEQRLVGASRDPFDINSRRALRADSAGAGDGTMSYDLANNPTGINWTATYVLETQHDVDLALDVESRVLWLGRDPLAGNELTLFENGLADPPGPSTGFCSAPIEAPDQIVPTTPSGFSAQGSGDRQLTFSWVGSTDEWGVAGYKIFDNGLEVAIAGSSATSLILTNVAPGNHIYTLRAFDNASPLGAGTNPVARLTAGMGNRYGNNSAAAALTLFNGLPVAGGSINVTDLIPPTKPTDLIATIDISNPLQPKINLSWTGSTDNIGVDHYIVHRNVSFSGSPVDFTVNGTSFTDGINPPALNSGLNQYTIEAVDTVGNLSGDSAALIVDLDAPNDGFAPTVPAGVTAVVGPDPIHGNNVALSWTAAVDGDLVAHKIYRANHTAPEALIAIVRGDIVTFNDNNLPAGTYHYTVTGIDLHGNESAHSAPPASVVVAHDVPLAGHSLIGFPSRDFISASGYNLVPQGNFHFELIRGIRTFSSASIQNAAGDLTGTIEVNHPGGTCWNTTTPDMRAGDVIRIVNEDTGIAEQTVVSNVSAELPIATSVNTVVIHGTAQDASGNPIPVGQLEHRLVSAGGLFDKNGSRTLRAAAGSDGTLVYDTINNPTGTKWTATYTGLSANDMLRALGGTDNNNIVFVAAESRAVWLGRAPLAGTELTIFENGSQVTGGPSAPCVAAAETAVAGASFTPASINFGNHSFNPLLPATPAQNVTFTNIGDAPMTIRNIYKAGLNSGDFNITANTCPLAPATLAAGANCTVSVNFKSTAFGLRQANLNFTDNAANTTDQSVLLTGTGVDTTDPLITVAPSPVAFGTVNGGASSTRIVTVTNNGTGLPLFISAASVTGAQSADFTKTGDTCTVPGGIPAAGSCTVTLQFRPGAAGARTATLTFTHNRALPSNLTSTPVTLNGTGGTGAVISINPGKVLNFKNVNRNTVSTQTITIQNNGTAVATGLTTAVSSTPVTIAGVTFNSFYSRTTTCGATLGVRATCNITVRFQAPNAVGIFNGAITVTTTNGFPLIATGAITGNTR